MGLRDRALSALARYEGKGENALIQETIARLKRDFGVMEPEIHIVDGPDVGPGVHQQVVQVDDLLFIQDKEGRLQVRDWLSITRDEDPWHEVSDLKELGDYIRKP